MAQGASLGPARCGTSNAVSDCTHTCNRLSSALALYATGWAALMRCMQEALSHGVGMACTPNPNSA